MGEAVVYMANSELGAGRRGGSLGPAAILFVAESAANSPLTGLRQHCMENTHHVLAHPALWHAKYITEIASYCEHTCKAIQKTSENGDVPFVLSGDHSTAVGVIGGLLRAAPQERLGVVWIDAHPDLQTPYTSTSGNMHGMTLAAVLGEGNKDARHRQLHAAETAAWTRLKALGRPRLRTADLALVATRSIDPPEEALITQYGLYTLPVATLRKEGLQACFGQLQQRLASCSRLFVSFDMDSLSKALVPGTGTPVKDGLSFEEALQLNEWLAQDKRLCGWEITELNPLLDQQGRSVQLAATLFQAVLRAYMQKEKGQ